MRDTTLTRSRPSNRRSLRQMPFLRLLSVLVVVVGCASSAWSAPTAITDAGKIVGVEGLEVGGKTLRVDFVKEVPGSTELTYNDVYGSQSPYFMGNETGAKEAAAAMKPVVSPYAHSNILIPFGQMRGGEFLSYGITRSNSLTPFPVFDKTGDMDGEAWFTKFTETSTPAVPVPSSLFLLGTGLFSLNAARRKKARQA